MLSNNRSGKTLEPFHIDWQQQRIKYIKYPSEALQFPRTPAHFEEEEKVVLNATRNSQNPWRLYAAIDNKKLVVTENFHYALLKDASSEEVTAVLNSTLANAWYSSRNYQRDINLQHLSQLPFPEFTDSQRERLRSLVHEIESYVASEEFIDHPRLRQMVQTLDDIVFDAYQLEAVEISQIQTWMNQFRRPGSAWEELDYPREPLRNYNGTRWEIAGEVERVNADKETVLMWVQGLNEAYEIPIPREMPGWLLRDNSSFVADIPWEHRYPSKLQETQWLAFHPLRHSYASVEELSALLSDSLTHE